MAAACLALAVTPRYMELTYGMQTQREMNSYARTGREVGMRLREVVPADTVIATTLAGTVAYYSKLTTIDQWGLNDAYVAHMPERPRFHRGHVKGAPAYYLQDRGVHLLIDHPAICSCDAPCVKGPMPHVFLRLTSGGCLRMVYLTARDDLTRLFCTDDRFVLRNLACE